MVLLRVNGAWAPATLTSYGSEAELQELLAADTSLLPGCAGNAVVREMSVPGSGYADLVLVDELGTITVVECKLQANPQIRREVVGQVLKYASLLWRLSYGEFEQAFRARAQKPLVEAVRSASSGDLDEELFRERLSASLAAGAVPACRRGGSDHAPPAGQHRVPERADSRGRGGDGTGARLPQAGRRRGAGPRDVRGRGRRGEAADRRRGAPVVGLGRHRRRRTHRVPAGPEGRPRPARPRSSTRGSREGWHRLVAVGRLLLPPGHPAAVGVVSLRQARRLAGQVAQRVR